jgi:hypothetical protein
VENSVGGGIRRWPPPAGGGPARASARPAAPNVATRTATPGAEKKFLHQTGPSPPSPTARQSLTFMELSVSVRRSLYNGI